MRGHWNDKPGVVFQDCTFHGPIVHPYASKMPCKATSFYGCHFEDRRYDFTGQMLVGEIEAGVY